MTNEQIYRGLISDMLLMDPRDPRRKQLELALQTMNYQPSPVVRTRPAVAPRQIRANPFLIR